MNLKQEKNSTMFYRAVLQKRTNNHKKRVSGFYIAEITFAAVNVHASKPEAAQPQWRTLHVW